MAHRQQRPQGARARVADARVGARASRSRARSLRGRAPSRARRRALSPRQFVESTRGYGKAPIAVTVGRGDVIKGWDEALLDMQAGESRWLIVPPALGYGEFGTQTYGGVIPPGATLYFDVLLKAIARP